MTIRKFALIAFMTLVLPAAGFAQQSTAPAQSTSASTLTERLIPASTVQLMAPAQSLVKQDGAATQPTQVTMPRGSGTGLMIAGGALFVAGLLIGSDVGTLLAVTGAAVGAYGLYLYFG